MTRQEQIVKAILAKAEERAAVERIVAIISNAIERADRFGERVVLLSRDEANQISESAGKLRQVTGT